jgi:hypothetical protein
MGKKPALIARIYLSFSFRKYDRLPALDLGQGRDFIFAQGRKAMRNLLVHRTQNLTNFPVGGRRDPVGEVGTVFHDLLVVSRHRPSIGWDTRSRSALS